MIGENAALIMSRHYDLDKKLMVMPELRDVVTSSAKVIISHPKLNIE